MICTLFTVKRSKIHGRGLFAGVDLLPGLMVPIVAAETDEEHCTRKTIEVGDTYWEPYHPFAFLNHSDYPNAEIFWCEEYECLYLHILKVIESNHEITIDYDSDGD